MEVGQESKSMAEVISSAEAIDGWMTSQELRWLYKAAKGRARAIEVGSWLGRSGKVISNVVTEWMVAIDLWQADHQDQYRVIQESMEGKSPDWAFRTFMNNLQDEIRAEKVLPVKSVSHKAAKWLSDLGVVEESVDFIFIDGNHKFPYVRRDIQNYFPYLRRGGLICGHDMDQSGVRRAVTRVFGRCRRAAGTIWYQEVE